ncbi:MAG: hypothetical protein KAH38_02425 [Candidatus Hydrogenedentes bacterium]|nr:hypothetical protein [Candidatus Hydrogenedentota bacterium]
MNEQYEPIDELDALISRALVDEPFLKAPVNLQRGVEARLRIARLRDREKARFSASITTLFFVFAVSLVLAAVAIWFTSLSFLYTEGVSGGKGHLDYYFTALAMYFSGYQGTYTLLMSFILAIGALAVALVLQLHKFIFTD